MNDKTEPQTLNEKAQFEVVWVLMAELDIAQIVVDFNGEGDSGDITGLNAIPRVPEPAWKANDPANDALRKAWAELAGTLNRVMEDTPTGIVRDGYSDRPGPYDLPLKDLVHVLTEPLLNHVDHDWVNNDGGYGNVTWDLADQTLTLDLSIRITSTEDYVYDYDKYGQEFGDE